MHPCDPSRELTLGQVEQAIAEIWQKILDVPEVRPNDSFFALDGDSMDAMLILSHVQERFGVELPQSSLFEHSTVSKLASAVCQHMTAEQAKSSPESRRMAA